MRKRADFVSIRLSAAGREAAAGGALRVVARHLDYTFEGSSAVEVLTSEWQRFFARERRGDALLFEIAEPEPTGISAVRDQADAEEKGE